MSIFGEDPVAEVRRNREMLLEKYGGIEGWHKHMEEDRPRLEALGWKFITVEEILAKKRASQNAPLSDAE